MLTPSEIALLRQSKVEISERLSVHYQKIQARPQRG
jgi:hypothetical protein